MATLTQGEEAQLAQTVEMFEVITQTQPHDYQSLEILKEAYSKLGRDTDVVNTSKRIAEAYVLMGQFSSAILEYETILQKHPDDEEVQAALKQIENKASNSMASAGPPSLSDTVVFTKPAEAPPPGVKKAVATSKTAAETDDGRRQMQKIFVDGKIVTAADFDMCWKTHDLSVPPEGVIEPFLQAVVDKGLVQADPMLKLLSDRSRVPFLPIEKYEIDIELARSFPADSCKRWCVLPFDRMSKTVLVATANPFNQQAAKELAQATNNRLLWYLVPPVELVKNLRKIFR